MAVPLDRRGAGRWHGGGGLSGEDPYGGAGRSALRTADPVPGCGLCASPASHSPYGVVPQRLPGGLLSGGSVFREALGDHQSLCEVGGAAQVQYAPHPCFYAAFGHGCGG